MGDLHPKSNRSEANETSKSLRKMNGKFTFRYAIHGEEIFLVGYFLWNSHEVVRKRKTDFGGNSECWRKNSKKKEARTHYSSRGGRNKKLRFVNSEKG